MNGNFPAVNDGTIGDAVVQTVNARDLHAFLGNRDHFATWIKDRIRQYGFSKGVDFTAFSEVSEKGRPSDEYALTIDMAKELAMVERNEKGKEARAYFIDCERRLRERPAIDPAKVLNDPAAMRGLLLTYTEKVLALEAVNAEMAPKVEAHDRIAESFGSTCRRIAAKNLGIPPLVLNRWMMTHGWTYQLPGNKDAIAYQSKISAGYLEHKVETGDKPDGTTWTRTSVRVTPKGMLALAKAFPPVVRDAKKAGGLAAAIAGMTIGAMAFLGSPEPAKALPVRDGLAVFNVGGRPVTVDTNRINVGPHERVLCLHDDGRIDYALLRLPAGNGPRSYWEEFRATRPGEPSSAQTISGIVQVLGVVV